MRELVQNLIQGLKRTDVATRVIVALSLVVLVGVVAVVASLAGRPDMVPLQTGLDDAQFNAVTRALANAGLRYSTSSPPGPYSVFIDEDQRYLAQNAIYAEGALDLGPRGIPAGSTSDMFKGKDERDQINLKRTWQEIENQLRALAFVDDATVRISPGPPDYLRGRRNPSTVSVVLRLRGTDYLSRAHRQTLAAIVRNATNVPDENITIVDQFGNSLFDGEREEEGFDAALQFERDFVTHETRRAQDFLDRVFGAGMAAVSIVGDWDHQRREVVSESFDPTKLKLSETVSETRTPLESSVVGGPAGIASNIDQANAGTSTTVTTTPAVAESADSEIRYTYGSSTTHTVQGAPTLRRLSITLTLDASLADRLGEARALVGDLVGFQEDRDQMTATALPLATVQRDAEGNPIAPEPAPVPEPRNPTIDLLMEHGVELLAAVAFLFVLLRSLKKSKPKDAAAAAAAAEAEQAAEEEVDLEALARRQIEQLVQNDPEKVGALLSRWALGDVYARSAR